MCIYFKNRTVLTYSSREHIFPAALGGIQMLDKEVVSNQANNIFSKWEEHAIHNDVRIAMQRDFKGPGSRGSIEIPSSKIQLITLTEFNNKKVLGYMHYGSPCPIFQFIIKKNSVSTETLLPKECTNKEIILQTVKKFNKFTGKHVFVDGHDRIAPDELIIGYHKGKFFISNFIRPNPDAIKDVIKERANAFEQEIYDKGAEQLQLENKVKKSQTELLIKIEYNSRECNKLIAKTGFNLLAKHKGTKYVLNDSFDRFRENLLGEKPFPEQDRKMKTSKIKKRLNMGAFTKNSHYTLIFNIDSFLYTCTDYYMGSMPELNLFLLGKDHDNSMPPVLRYVCDWQNKKEHFEALNFY